MKKKERLSIQKLINYEFDCGLALGNFDGVHLGHQDLIDHFVQRCHERRLKSVLLTFAPHPALFFEPHRRFLIQEQKEKLKSLSDRGLDEVVVIDFNKEIQELSPSDFLKKYLLSIKSLKLIYLGHDFKLGKGKKKAFSILENLIRPLEIELLNHHSVKRYSEVISSSLIRNYIVSDIEKANELLGYDFKICGKVIEGKKNGSKYLFPTANIEVHPNQIFPKPGVYLTKIQIEEKTYQGLTNIGFNPTLGSENELTIEVHILFFNSEIYGKVISLSFFKKLREEKRFDSLAELKEQITSDIEVSKQFFRQKSSLKLALIGRNIQHSKSQQIYEKHLGRCISYELIDCLEAQDIPSLEELSVRYQGVSITSPYKEHFSFPNQKDQVSVYNTLVFGKEGIRGENTDLLAFRDLFSEYLELNVSEVMIIGDGSMSKMIKSYLKCFDVKVGLYSRRLKNLDQLAELSNKRSKDLLIINTCARDYTYSAPKEGSFYFWDMNYDLKKHKELFEILDIKYQDGKRLLELQAKYALSLWDLKTF